MKHTPYFRVDRRWSRSIEVWANARGEVLALDMEAVLAIMHDDVVWANGLEGGHV